MMEFALVALALALVGAGVWIARLAAERARLAAQLEHELARAQQVAGDEQRLRDSFRALASETLKTESAQFLQLAEQKFAAREAKAVAEFEKRRVGVDRLVQPIGEALKKTQEELRRIESARDHAYAGLREQVQSMQRANAELSGQTQRLAQALSKPNVRGRYGEIQLQRVAELAGMQAYCDFATQESVRDSAGRLARPDMVVKLPNERVIAVDAKTNIEAYLAALDVARPEDAEPHLVRFAKHVADQVQALGKKGYWAQFDAPEFTVMFVPGDQFVDAALERRPDLIELAARANVVLASPSTLIGLLRAVHLGWREKRFSEDALKLQELGQQLLERFGVALGHVDRVGTSLRRAVDDYNGFVASVDTRVMPTLRKFEESSARAKEPIKELKPVEGVLRARAGGPDSAVEVKEAP
jgi:DNA recombination protein RmuC